MKYRFLFTVGAGLIMLSVTGCSNNKSNANSSSKSEIIKKNSNVKKKKHQNHLQMLKIEHGHIKIMFLMLELRHILLLNLR